jgi:type VI protein secretion system component Hcp
MNNEPVAYGMLTFCKNCGEQNPYSAKTLTDEEIRHIQAQCHLKDVGYDTFIMRFAR